MEQYEENGNYSFEENPQQEPVTPQPAHQKKKGKGGLIALFIAVALVASCGGAMLSRVIDDVASRNETKTAMAEAEIEKDEPEQTVTLEENPLPEKLKTNKGNKTLTAAEVYKENVDAVVGIRTELITTNIWGQLTEASSAGTGFILSEDGYIVTNHHVINGAETVKVALYNGEEYEAKIIASDSVNDVALLKIEAEDLKAVSIGKSEDLTVGEEVVAIGNPLGELTFTMTHGYISALDRYINTSGTPINMLQTDAAINAGNSGGPLFDMNGNVIAMNTAKPGTSTANGTTVEGIGFAIPIDDVISIVYDLQQNGKVTGRAYLGITPRDMNQSFADNYNMPVGVFVYSVEKGSCAEKAGIQEKDIILAVNDEKISATTDLRAALNRLKAGDEAELTIYRGGAEQKLTVTLDEAPSEDTTEQQTQPEQQDNDRYYFNDPFEYFRSFGF